MHGTWPPRWQRRAGRFFADYDVFMTPGLAQPPMPAIAWSQRGWLTNIVHNARYAPFCAPWNLAGWPAMSVPAVTGQMQGTERSRSSVSSQNGVDRMRVVRS